MARNNPYALRLDNSTYIDIPNIKIGEVVTICGWFNTSITDDMILWSWKANSYSSPLSLYYCSDQFNNNTGDGSDTPFSNSSKKIIQGDWAFYTVVHEPVGTKLFINGEFIGTAEYKNPVANNTIVRINGWTANTQYRLSGMVDNVSLWNKALTPKEVKYYMNKKLKGNEEGLAGYWPLDEGEGNIAHDLSPYQNHGTIYNAQWVEGEVDLELYYSLIKSNNKYYTYQNNEFIEVEPTVENFENNSIDLSQLTTPTNKVILTMEDGEVLEDGKIYRKTIDMSKYKSIGRMVQYIDLEDGDANVSIE